MKATEEIGSGALGARADRWRPVLFCRFPRLRLLNPFHQPLRLAWRGGLLFHKGYTESDQMEMILFLNNNNIM
ncbi:hypothetical protein EP10_002527 [Geobacillus icigianus]|uniref:Uncharacterized protein n=1 Tax=Geobacillus icigianus TaxID=1430331 RepID=A0ABU6BIE8_9BACL|nr:hypothetical protein [Geobacillus icigianus]